MKEVLKVRRDVKGDFEAVVAGGAADSPAEVFSGAAVLLAAFNAGSTINVDVDGVVSLGTL